MARKSPSEDVKPYRCEAHVSFDGETCSRCGVDLESLCEACEVRVALFPGSGLGHLCRECEIAEVEALDDRARQGLGIVDRTGN